MLVNTSRENSLNLIDFGFTGNLEIKEAIIAGWDLSRVSADIIYKKFELGVSYPNPFNPSAIIEYSVPYLTNITINIYDISGKLIKRIINKVHSPGIYQISIEANDIPAGIYFVNLNSNQENINYKITVVK